MELMNRVLITCTCYCVDVLDIKQNLVLSLNKCSQYSSHRSKCLLYHWMSYLTKDCADIFIAQLPLFRLFWISFSRPGRAGVLRDLAHTNVSLAYFLALNYQSTSKKKLKQETLENAVPLKLRLVRLHYIELKSYCPSIFKVYLFHFLGDHAISECFIFMKWKLRSLFEYQ